MESQNQNQWNEKMASCSRLLIGLGGEWKLPQEPKLRGEWELKLRRAYETLSSCTRDKDYFIVTMATDALIYDTSLGSREEKVWTGQQAAKISGNCPEASGNAQALMEQLFPLKESSAESRWQRITAPCGNETWRQCSRSCTRDIWEPGELPEDLCPHCGAPLTGNTIQADAYIEEGYLPQWQRYTQWLTKTLSEELLVLELGVGFQKPEVIRFPFEKIAFYNQKAFLCRVHHAFPQLPQELRGRGVSFAENAVDWVNGWTQNP